MIVNKKSLAVIHCASKDANRRNLNAIHFAEDGSTVATNGHVLARIVPKDIEKREKPFSMVAESVASLVKRVGRKGSIAVLNVEGMLNKLILDEEDFPYALTDAEFPNWKQVHKEPEEEDVKFEVDLSAAVLESMIAATRQFTGTSKGSFARLKFTFTSPDTAAFVRVKGGDGDVLEFSVMPVGLRRRQ